MILWQFKAGSIYIEQNTLVNTKIPGFYLPCKVNDAALDIKIIKL